MENKSEITVYISGPISGTSDYPARFSKAVFMLLEAGYKRIINPAQMDGAMIGADQEDFLDISLKLVDKADILAMLPGWENSMGCNREVGFATAKGKQIMSLEEALRKMKDPGETPKIPTF